MHTHTPGHTRRQFLSLCFLILPLHALAQPTTSNASLELQSDPGDFIGQGQSYSYPPGSLPVVGYAPGGKRIEIVFGIPWQLYFAAPDDRPLTPGVYLNATRYPFQEPGVPGLAITGGFGPGGGCNTLTGSFTVYQVAYQPSPYPSGYGGIASFWARFEQHCEGAAPALRGEVKYNIPTVSDIPGLSLPGLLALTSALFVIGLKRLRNA